MTIFENLRLDNYLIYSLNNVTKSFATTHSYNGVGFRFSFMVMLA